jgi:hypothetical protein
MTDQFPDTTKVLSPAAQAVFTAILNLKDNVNPRHRIAAAALRAAADQVVPDTEYESHEVLMIAMNVRHNLLAIAAELEAQ